MRTEIFSHSRHPFQVFVLALCLVTTIPTILGFSPAPGSMQAIVPWPIAVIWAYILFGGAAAGLFSAFMKNRGTGLIVEQFGLSLAGLSCCFYACVVGYYGFERGALIPAGMVGGFGIACLVRAGQIQKYLDRMNRASLRLKHHRRHPRCFDKNREVGHGS